MKYLIGNDKNEAIFYMHKAKEIALFSTCARSKCGSIIVSDDGKIIGEGFNSPPNNDESQRRCFCNKDDYHKKVVDKTCCVHAEQRAIIDALKKNPSKILNSKLYFIRLGENDEISFAGKPYCTICSKMSLDVGIKEFILWHQKGICSYNTLEYNYLSYSYNE